MLAIAVELAPAPAPKMQQHMKLWGLLLASLSLIFFFQVIFCYSKLDQAPNYSTFMREATEAPTISYYDYIIIGGGTTGIPLAATLSQTSRVLVLERGGSPYGNDNITHLSGFMDTLCDTSPTSASQTFVSEDGVPNQRARVLGGGTCLNGGFYSRASHEFVVEAGWDEKLVNQSYDWIERLLIEEAELLQWQSAVKDGLKEAGIRPDNGFTVDHVIGTKVGGTIFDKDGHRRTAADLLTQANPNGILVFLHATAERILFKHTGQARPIASGVMFKDSRGVTHQVFLNKGTNHDIIISAGAIGSPQLLMLSGIGPRDHLQSLGIEVVLHQPFVGQNISDNPLNPIYIPSPSSVETALVQLVGITNFGSYIESIVGDKYLICQPSSERSSSTSFRAGFLFGKVADPISTGYLKLVDTTPDSNPSVTFNYFSEPQDLQTCVKGLETIKRVIESEAFSKYKYPDVSFDSLLQTTLEYLGVGVENMESHSFSLEQYCKDTVRTIWHYHGGCQVGRVVDRDYRVMGVDGLRVLDGSTFDASPGTNPQATFMMLGRYMGIKIQSERMDNTENYIAYINGDFPF